MEHLKERRENEDYIEQKIGKTILFKRFPMKKQKAFKRKTRLTHADYNFLQYSRPIKMWAKTAFGLKDRELDVLLWLFPLNIFSRKEFLYELDKIGIRDYRIMDNLRKEGWVQNWKKDGALQYYVLSHKANDLIKRIHRMYMFEEPIPMSERRNPLVANAKSKDKSLMEMFKAFNQKVLENTSNS